MKVQAITLLAIISALAAQDSPQVYCGRRLARTLAVLCSEDYLVKRSGTVDRFGYGPYGYESGYVSPWLAAKEAHGLNGRGKRQLVVSECCEKACTIEELITYCSN